MTVRKSRIVLFAAVAMIGAVLTVFAVAIVDNRDTRREAAAERFKDEAAVTASVIRGIFEAGAPQAAEENAKRFGGPEIDQKALDALKKQSQLTYAVILDAQGNVIASTQGVDESITGPIEERPSHVANVLKGQPWHLGGITRGDVAEYASSFQSSEGPRVIVQGFPIELISGLLGGTLAGLPNAEKEQGYISDRNGRVLGAAQKSVKPASPEPKLGADREETRVQVGNTDLSVVLSQKEADLYKGQSSSVQWLILIALALAGLVTIFLLRRAMRQASDLSSAYDALETTNSDLERTNQELQRSNGELEQFASVASHDLQEPLRKVQTFGDQLERRHAADLNDEARDYLRRMRNASARMSVLIDDLLLFSRVTTHAKPHVAVDLNRVARDVLQDLEARVDETHGQVELSRLPIVQADPTQMRQLLQNLIGNALKFHRPDVPPVVRLGEVRSPRPGSVAFEISDNGIGFENTYQDRIFRVFERLHPRDVYAGTGIGLALCRKIAERHGGNIEADGRPDEGATFTVVLPAVVPSQNGRSHEPAPVPEPVHA